MWSIHFWPTSFKHIVLDDEMIVWFGILERGTLIIYVGKIGRT